MAQSREERLEELLTELKQAFVDHVSDPYPEELELLDNIDDALGIENDEGEDDDDDA